MSKTRRSRGLTEKTPHSNDPEKLKQIHAHCVSKAWMQLTYARSSGFELCDEDGTFNPVGMWVRKPGGKIEQVRGQCSFEHLPDWQGCPFGESKPYGVLQPPSLEKIEKLLEMDAEKEFTNAVIIESAEFEQRDEPEASLESPELEASMKRLDALLKKRKEKKQ